MATAYEQERWGKRKTVTGEVLNRRDFLKLGGSGLAGLLLLGASGCGSQGAGLLAPDRIGRADAPNSFSLQLNADYSHQAPTPSWAKGFEKLFTKWAKEHPDWRIDLKIVPSEQSTQASARLVEEAKAGRAPDCANINFTEIPLFVQQGILQPVGEFFSKEEIDNLFPFVRETITGLDGKIYAYWFNTDLRALYRRTDLVPEAPKTWDDLIQAALEVKEQDQNVDGYLFNGGRWVGTSFDNLAHFWSQGGELVDDNGKPIFNVGENRTYMLNALDFLRRTIDSGASPQRVATITDYSEFNTAAQSSTVAMFLGGHWQSGELEGILPPEEFEKWEVSFIPTMNAGDDPATSNGGWTLATLTEDRDKVSTFMDFVRTVYMGPANEVTGQLPTSPKLFDKLQAFQTPVYDQFREMLKFGHTLPASPINNQLLNELQVGISGTLTGELTPDQAIDAAAEDLTRTYKRVR